MKQSILKKNPQQTYTIETDPIASNNSILTRSFESSNLTAPRSVQTSKNVRFIGVDLNEQQEKQNSKDVYSFTRSATSLNGSIRNGNKKNAINNANNNNTIPLKQFSICTKPEDNFTLLYQNNGFNNGKNKNNIYYYQQQQAHQLTKGLRITSATIENRLVKSSIPFKRTPLENSPNKQTSVTPIRTPILISNLLASANNISNSSNSTNEKNHNTNYFYYINRTNNSAKNSGLISADSQNLLSSTPVNKLKLKELSNLERIGTGNENAQLSPSSLDIKSQNILPATSGTGSATPSVDENKSINKNQNSSTLTLYAYLLQSNKNMPKDFRASILRAQTKQLNNRDDINNDFRSRLLEETNGVPRFRRTKLDLKSDNQMKITSRVSSASVNTQLSEDSSIVKNSIQIADNNESAALVES